MPRLSDYAAALGRSPDGLGLVHGQQADVVLDPGGGSAWRFPRYEEERRRLPDHARRLEQVGALGLPVDTPQVRSVRAQAPLGEAYVETSLIRGLPLGRAALLVPTNRRQRLAEQLADILRGLRAVDASGVDLDRSGWGDHWLELEARATSALLPAMSNDGRKRATSELRWAAGVAQDAPITFVHGDLGGSNILVDPALGKVTGIIDWDSARLGDPAVDVAALATALDAALREELLRAEPMLRDDLTRAAAYRATFALQEALFGAERGDDDAVQAGLADYQR